MTPPLYKFRTIDKNDFAKCFTLDSLRNSYVYFASIATLNDPFEMGAYLDQASDIEAARIEFMKRDWSQSPIGVFLRSMNEEERKAYLESRWNNDEWRNAFIEAWRKCDRFDDDLKKSLSIYCASGTRTDGLLWAHYASGHQGIAIELNPNTDLILANAYPVNYQEEFPVIDMLCDSIDTKFKKGLLTKFRDWKYEQEFRAVFPSFCEGVRYEVAPTVFVSITFGAKISDETRERVIEATRPRLSHISFYQAHLGRKSFSMEFESYQV
jgi:hypothetical protein